MNEHFYMEIYLADTPHRRNAQHFGGGSEQLRICKQKNVQKTDVSVREIVKSVREQKSTERKKHPFMKTADKLPERAWKMLSARCALQFVEDSSEWGRRSGLRQPNEGEIFRKVGRTDCGNDFSDTL